ncbi:MAG: hemolysin III family protein [Ruminococcaceae bacterium]|nr:hemolysin III family protein [Oscillospiraceae bacterium]
MKRTSLRDRILPDYTKGEEIFNMVSHIVGGALGVAYLVLCVIMAALHRNPYGVVGAAIYGASVIILFTMSSIYHGLRPGMAKKVFQVIDHCTIYVMIAGTYTPITLSAMRPIAPARSWVLFGLVWGITFAAMVFTAIDHNKFKKLSMICYIGLGWLVIGFMDVTYAAIGLNGLIFLALGGLLYTVGAVLYGVGKKHRYVHSLFHIFVDLASLMHFFCILFYVV